MRILVIGGMHGNEPLGLGVIALLKKQPLINVNYIAANPRAIAAKVRFLGQDLNRSFPGNTETYEQRRAATLLALAQKYDVVLDFHNTHCSGNDCGFVGDTADQALYDVAWNLGLKRVVVADYDCINKYAPNCLSVEISLDSTDNQPELWYRRIAELSQTKSVKEDEKLERYKFVYRMTLEDRDRLALDQQDLRAFQPLPRQLSMAMKVKSPAYPIFVGDAYTPYNYGGLLNRINEEK